MSGGGRVTPSSEPPDMGVPKAEVDSSSLELPQSAPPGHCPCLAAVKLVFVEVGVEELPPSDWSVYIEAGGTLVATVGGSSPAVVKLSSPSVAEMTIACEREKGARGAMEEVGQNFDLMGQAQKCSIKRISTAGVRSHMRHNTGPQQVLKNKTMGQLNEEKMWALEEGENLTITDANNVELTAGHGAAGENIHIQLSSGIEINYEMYARFSRLLSLDSWAYLYANKTRSTTSVFFMPYDSSDGKDDFYVFFYSCDGNHGGFDCSVEIATHQGHVWSSILLIVLSAATILPAYWSLWQKTSAEWVILTSSRISSGIYPAGDANIMNFRSYFIFKAAISTFLYLATIDEGFKKVIHTTVAILTALMAVINATRPSNVVLVFVIGASWTGQSDGRHKSFRDICFRKMNIVPKNLRKILGTAILAECSSPKTEWVSPKLGLLLYIACPVVHLQLGGGGHTSKVVKVEVITGKKYDKKKSGRGITIAIQDIEIVLDFFLFDPGGIDADSEGGCVAIMNSCPIFIIDLTLVAEVHYTSGVEVNFQNNFLRSQISATNFQDNACGFLLILVVFIPPIFDGILDIIVACCKRCGAETSSTKMGSKEWGFHLSGFKQWDPDGCCSSCPILQMELLAARQDVQGSVEMLVKGKQLPTYENSWETIADVQEQFPIFHLEDKVNFEGEGIDVDMRRPRRP